MITPELSAAIDALITTALARGTGANENPRCLEIYSTSALFAYYLAPSGLCYELDLDRWPRYERVESIPTARDVYAQAAARFPELAALAECDPGAPPTTFEAALAYPAHVIAAWDDADPTGTTLVAIAVGNSGARRLASRTVAAVERAELYARLGRDHERGATLGELAWYVSLIAGFHLHDATGLRTSYVRPWEVDRVRSSRAIELVAPDGATTRVIDHVEPAVASRIARDFANYLERPHDDNGRRDANADDLRLVRAARELLERRTAQPRIVADRVAAGPYAGAVDVQLRRDEDTMFVEATVDQNRTGGQVVLAPLPHADGCWLVRDIVRAIAT